MMSLVTFITEIIWLLVALIIDCFFFMVSGLIMFYSLVLLLRFFDFFDRDETLWRDIMEIAYMVQDVFLYMWIVMTLKALLLHVRA